MLPSQFRLSLVTFRHNPDRPIHHHSPFFTLSVKKSQTQIPRFVIFVPKVLDRRSVVRHKTKRIMAELLRLAIPQFQSFCLIQKQGREVSIRMKKLITRENKLVAQKELAEIIKRISASAKG